jgi:crotonobetainyl-CoA:carnitine CoA-transferase CaiB-like acyl-CoA transferase
METGEGGSTRGALASTVVLELGGREAAGVCGLLLAELGATVILCEPMGEQRMRDTGRAQLAAGKLSFLFDPASARDKALLAILMERCDVVLTSSDVDGAAFHSSAAQPRNVICDITAFGNTGPRTGEALSEAQVQALAGLVDTTGIPGEPPVPIGVPVVGHATGTYAAAGVLAALRVKRLQGFGQRVDVAMFDSAFLSLNAFLAGVLTGQADDRSRLGNRHPTVAPWNLYETADGWIYICAGNQGQWERLCAAMGRAGLAPQFATQGARIDGVEEIDAAIEAWTRTQGTAECVDRLGAAGVACGPIAPIDEYPREANLAFRGAIRSLQDPVSLSELFVPASPLGLRGTEPVQAAFIPAPGQHRAAVDALARTLPPPRPNVVPTEPRRPLAGVRVVEIGQFTSAPMCARNLAHLGADVIKIEKPGGDDQRSWVPFFGGRSETFLLNNADKRGMVVDLTTPAGRQTLQALLRTADVLVENNKPGTLSKFGFGAEALHAINPRLVVCAITAFGSESLYASRPGFDTVIQAMSGFMTVVRPGGTPLKSGISTADVMGAKMAMVAIFAALEQRERTGRGQFIDLSMQDITCWLTAPVWNRASRQRVRPAVLPCRDGYVLVEDGEEATHASMEHAGLSRGALNAMGKSEAAHALTALQLRAAPVNTLREAADMPQTLARAVWHTLPACGLDWPVLASPLRLQITTPKVARLAPDVDEHGAALRHDLGTVQAEQQGSR